MRVWWWLLKNMRGYSPIFFLETVLDARQIEALEAISPSLGSQLKLGHRTMILISQKNR